MDEISEMKINTSGADGEISSSRSRRWVPEHTIDNRKLEVVTHAAGESSTTTSESNRRFKYRIEKVPPVFRKNEQNKGDYDPKEVSLGPYHHGKSELQSAENLKPMLANLFFSDCHGKEMDQLTLRLMVDDARSCYIEGSTGKYSDEKFAEMMILDGCFILSVIGLCTSSNKEGIHESEYSSVFKSLGTYSRTCFVSDMLLLENQLPFQVLKFLMSLKFQDVQEGMTMIDDFLDAMIFGDKQPQNKNQVKKARDHKKQLLHLLELYRIKMASRSHLGEDKQTLQNLKSPRESKFEAKHSIQDFLPSFRSVTELKAKGIHVRLGSTPFLKDIVFKSGFFHGHLELPSLGMSEADKQVTLNLIAYELCPNSHKKLVVTAYINFMKSIINHPDDVKELRSERVLLSNLGSDEEVVKIFQSFRTYDVDDYSIYDEVKERIQEHYNSSAKTWMAELINTYFSGPWTFIAFLAAAFGIAMTFIQTCLALFPRQGSK